MSTSSWETRLLALACTPLKQKSPAIHVDADTETLKLAYRHCERVTAQHSKTFYLASNLLPPDKRRAMRVLYAFCRVSDDLVDRPPDDAIAQKLEVWRAQSLADHPAIDGLSGDSLVSLAWADARARYRIPVEYAHQLLDGVARDIDTTRYNTFDQLAEYAYGVASTVGLMAMHITGFEGAAAVPYAIKLGVALQLTNVLRDVGEDWRNGRLYLPLDELARFGLSEADVAAGRIDDRWRALMRFQIARARQLYAEALPGIALLHPDGRLAIAAAAELYRAILADIENHDYDVYTRRARVSRWGKLRRLPGIWWRSWRGYPPRTPWEGCHD
ncbi:MAG: squalene/phytoene synthase family protein [Anaerolineae bacterium]|nr:squalene/phytoene synthase family protein [Anaerolineae bacterium]